MANLLDLAMKLVAGAVAFAALLTLLFVVVRVATAAYYLSKKQIEGASDGTQKQPGIEPGQPWPRR